MKTRGAAATQHSSEHIEGRSIRVIQRRGFPSKGNAAGGDGESFTHPARAKLGWIDGNQRFTPTTSEFIGGEFGRYFSSFSRIKISRNHDKTAVRRVACLMVAG